MKESLLAHEVRTDDTAGPALTLDTVNEHALCLLKRLLYELEGFKRN